MKKNSDLDIALSTEISTDESHIQSLQEKMNTLDESIDQLQQILLSVTKNLEKYEGQKELMMERKKNASNQTLQFKEQLDEFKKQIHVIKDELMNEQKTKQTIQAVLKELQDQIKSNENEILIFEEDLEEQIESIKSDYIELLNNQASASNEKNILETQLEQYSVKANRLDSENEKYIRQRQVLKQKKDQLLEELANLEAKWKEDGQIVEQNEKAFESLSVQLKEKEDLLYKAYQFVQQTKSRKDTLEELQEDYSGFNQGVKEILKARDSKLQGIEGAVAELIMTEKQYEVAIEIALGAATQQIIVQAEEHARQAIQFLKQQRLGRATFLPMSVVKARSIPEQSIELMRRHETFIGIGSSLVTYKDKYDGIIKNLLGTVVITKDLKGANELAKQIGHRYRFVTLEGDVVNPGGAMTGGAMRVTNNSLLSRQRELDEITEKLKVMQEKTTSLELEVKQLKQKKQELNNVITEKKASFNKNQESLRLVQDELRSIEFEEKNINDTLAIYDLEMGNSLEENNRISSRVKELIELQEKLKEEISKNELLIEELTEKKNNQKLVMQDIQVQLTDLKVKVAEEQQKLQHCKERIFQKESDLDKYEQSVVDLNDKIVFLSSELMTNENGKEELEKLIQETRNEFSKTTELISSRREERLAFQNEIEDYSIALREKQRQYKSLSDLLKQQEINCSRLDVELENRLQHLSEIYMLSFEAAKQKYTLSIEIEDARKKVKLLKRAIEELGTVNIGAIDEYERVSERYEFLQEQRTDLIDAKTTLHSVIDEMDEEMTRRFETSFRAIREKFQIVFTQLFGGGRADLVLSDESNLLMTGVDIVAQPPGKKLQNLGLLSGGERALTAIALLFAILQVRPVPFCVLDEVEAALDEANVARFAKFLKKFSSQTQFIVITHRKGTMEECDVLYGVTMQESGVSTLVSVRLDEGEEILASEK
jgi:chromosome segregation protein